MDSNISAILCVLVTFLLYILLKKPKNYPPGPRKWPLLGTLPSMKVCPGDPPFENLERLRQKYGDLVGLFIGPQPAILVSGYQCVKDISTKEEFSYRPNIITPRHEMFKEKKIGVFFSEGGRWKNQRRFTLRHLRDFGFGKQTMDQYIHEEVAVLFAKIDELMRQQQGQKDLGLDVMSVLPAVAINTLWYIIAGVKHELDDQKFVDLTKTVLRFFRLGDQGSPVNFYRALQHVPFINKVFQQQKQCGFELNNYVKEALHEHLKSFDENHLRDFMDVYIQEMKTDTTGYFTEEQLITICVDLFLAGTETTASTIGFTLRYLVWYPEIQEKVRQELYHVVGKNRTPSMDDMPNLPFCTAVLTESIRHSGVTPFTPPRAPIEEVSYNGYTFPKRCMLMVNIRSVLMDPSHWGDPEIFRPERFIDADGKFKKDDHLILFGTGMRMCLGEPFARNTTFIFYTSLIQNYIFASPPNGPKPSNVTQPGFTTSPAPFRVAISKA